MSTVDSGNRSDNVVNVVLSVVDGIYTICVQRTRFVTLSFALRFICDTVTILIVVVIVVAAIAAASVAR